MDEVAIRSISVKLDDGGTQSVVLLIHPDQEVLRKAVKRYSTIDPGEFLAYFYEDDKHQMVVAISPFADLCTIAHEAFHVVIATMFDRGLNPADVSVRKVGDPPVEVIPADVAAAMLEQLLKKIPPALKRCRKKFRA